MSYAWIASPKLKTWIGTTFVILSCARLCDVNAADLLIEIPPVNYAGSAGYSFLTTKTGEEDRTFRNAVTGSIVGSSYIWQPWFIGVNGELNAMQFKTNTGDKENGTNAFSGRLGMGILPLSDFPVDFSYVHTDDRIGKDYKKTVTISDSVNLSTRVMWDQTLRFNGALGYSFTTQEDDNEQSRLNSRLGFDKKFEQHVLGGTITSQVTDKQSLKASVNTQSRVSNVASLRHQYSPWDNVIYDSTSTVLLSDSETINESEEDFLLQTTSTLQWTPTEYPLAVTAATRSVTQKTESVIAKSDTTAGNKLVDNKSLNSRVGATYRFSNNLNFDSSLRGALVSNTIESTEASGTSSRSSNNDGSIEMTYGGSAGTTYTSFQSDLQGFKWRWSTGAQMSADGGSKAEMTYGSLATANQSFNRQLAVPFFDPVMFSLSEGFRLSKTGDDSPLAALSHAVSLTHSSNEDSSWTIISLSASDSRSVSDETQSASQLFNLQLTEGLQTGESSTWTANLTSQVSHSSSNNGTDKWDTFTQGGLRLAMRDVFAVRRLSYNAEIRFEANRLTPISFEAPSSGEEDPINWRRRFSNSLSYMIGKVKSELRLTLSQNERQEITDMTMFQLSRGF